MAVPIRITSKIESEILKHMVRYDLADIANAWIQEHKEIVKPETVGVCYVPTTWKILDGPLASKLEIRGIVLRFTMGAAGEILHEPMETITLERALPRVDVVPPTKH